MGQLALYVETILRGAPGLEILVEEIQIGAVELAHCLMVRIRQRYVRIVLERDECVETTIDVNGSRTVAKKARVAEVVIDDRSVVDSIAAADDGLFVDRVSEADAWSNVGPVRFHEPEMFGLQSALADCSDDGSAPATCRGIRCVGIKAAQEAARLFTRTAVVVSDTNIHRQLRRH